MQELKATVYPVDQLARRDDVDVIDPKDAPTLDAQFRERVRRSGDRVAYTDYDFAESRWRDYTWNDIAAQVVRWQTAFRKEGLQRGDRVAIRLRNCRHWVAFDQAALGLGLVVVPLYIADRPQNINYVLDNSDAKLLLLADFEAWWEIESGAGDTPDIKRVVVLNGPVQDSSKVIAINDWLPQSGGELARGIASADDLASIVYTSGTTGQPKGVMLSHNNMVANAYAGLRSIRIFPSDHMLSFLPLSHTLERTVGYYVPLMAGARITYVRSIPDLSDDLVNLRPTGIITVPRVFERALNKIKTRVNASSGIKQKLFKTAVEIGWNRFEHRQGRGPWKIGFLFWPIFDYLVARKVRNSFGGNLRLVVSGGAPLPFPVAKVFLALEMNLLQGYGLTESSPCISINTMEQNVPTSIGLPLHGVEVKIGERGELLAKGPNIMMGYWKNQAATDEVIKDGWLYSGDIARIDDGFITITGRIKDILVLANGEKVSPADMESAISHDALFDQSLMVGEQMPYLTALVVLNADMWRAQAKKLGVEPDDPAVLESDAVQEFLLARIAAQISGFPGYARARRVYATLEPWTIENGLLTPTLKTKRPKVMEHYSDAIDRMYAGHVTYKQPIRDTA